MAFPEDLYIYTAMLVTVAFVVLFTFIGLVYDECKEFRKKDHASQAPRPQREAHEEKVEEPSEESEDVTVIISEPSPAESALWAANRQSLQMNLSALEAHRLLSEAARRYEPETASAEDCRDAEWRI